MEMHSLMFLKQLKNIREISFDSLAKFCPFQGCYCENIFHLRKISEWETSNNLNYVIAENESLKWWYILLMFVVDIHYNFWVHLVIIIDKDWYIHSAFKMNIAMYVPSAARFIETKIQTPTVVEPKIINVISWPNFVPHKVWKTLLKR